MARSRYATCSNRFRLPMVFPTSASGTAKPFSLSLKLLLGDQKPTSSRGMWEVMTTYRSRNIRPP